MDFDDNDVYPHRNLTDSEVVQRSFSPVEHIRNIIATEPVAMYDETGQQLDGIAGANGVRGYTHAGIAIGLDRIVMQRGSAFPLHAHEGDHVLWVLSGNGWLRINGINYPLSEGDAVYVPADYPHGVLGPTVDTPLEILSFGVPHHRIQSLERMRLMPEPDSPDLEL